MNISVREMVQYGLMLIALGVSWANNTSDSADLQAQVARSGESG